MKMFLRILGLMIFPLTPCLAATVLNSSTISASVSTSTVFNQIVDLGPMDSASWQMSFTCAKGSVTLQESNDAVNWVSINVAGSSITVNGSNSSTTANQLFSIAAPAYRYVNFAVVNSSAPASGTASPCTLKAVQCLKSDTVTSN